MTDNTLIINYNNFQEVFKLKTNHIDDNASYDGCMFETYGVELEFVKDHAQEHIWTILDGDGTLIVSNGYQYVNRIGYLISEIPVPDNFHYEVHDEKEAITITAQHVLDIATDIIPNMDDGEAQELLDSMHDEIFSDLDQTIRYRINDIKHDQEITKEDPQKKEITLQRKVREFVEREITQNVSQLITFHIETDIDRIMEFFPNLIIGYDENDEPIDIYEYWIVTKWFADKLKEQNEVIEDNFHGLTIWGRTTTGQAISMDSVIQEIYQKLGQN